MVPKKHGSNRMSAYLKYKIARNVRDHNRKAKKAARANPNTHRLKKDPGIPSLWPFKDRLVQQVLEAKEQARIDREAKREAYRAKQIQASQLKREEALLEEEARTVEDLQQRAERRAAQFEREQRRKSTDAQRSMQGEAGLQVNDNSRRAYYREFRKVVEAADVILQVLDARDPLGCRSPQIEEMILKAGGGDKKIILVLNKVDLVPRKNVEAWIKYLSHEFPTIAFKASTQQQRTNIGHGSSGALNAAASSGGSDDSAAITTSECLGADSLIRLLKNYSRSHDIKTSLRVGVVGFPNVGKSSLINSLRRSRVCGVGAVAGFTKTAQEVILDKNIRLLDCPGILFTGDDATVDPSIVLRNCVRVEAIADPVGAVGYLLTRLPKKQVMLLYRVGDFDSTIRFLVQIAAQKGKLKRGGIADLEGAARTVIADWNGGKIPYFTNPPAREDVLSSTVVSGFSSTFSVDTDEDQVALMQSLDDMSNDRMIELSSLPVGTVNVDMLDDEDDDMNLSDDDDDEEDMDDDEDDLDDEDEDMDEDMDEDEDEDDDEDDLPTSKPTRQGMSRLLTTSEKSVNPQSNLSLRKLQKKHKKAERRAERRMREAEAGSDDDMPSYDLDLDGADMSS